MDLAGSGKQESSKYSRKGASEIMIYSTSKTPEKWQENSHLESVLSETKKINNLRKPLDDRATGE